MIEPIAAINIGALVEIDVNFGPIGAGTVVLGSLVAAAARLANSA